MAASLRQFFNTKAGYVTASVGVAVIACALFFSIRSSLRGNEAVRPVGDRWVVCSETGKAWEITLKPGMTFPIDSPYSGKRTGYVAEAACNWTSDGKVGTRITYLLMNDRLGKKGPTFCPDCHRQVVRDNPAASPGRSPPPTEQEYAAKHGGR